MVCQKCGRGLGESDPFCPACGTPRALYAPPEGFVAVEGEALYYRFEPAPHPGDGLVHITSFDPAKGKYTVLCPPTALPGGGPEGYDWSEAAGAYCCQVPYQSAAGKGRLVTSVDPETGHCRQSFYPDRPPVSLPGVPQAAQTPPPLQMPREPSPPAEAPHAAVLPLNLGDSYRRSGKSRRLLLLALLLLVLGALAFLVVAYVLPAYQQGKTIYGIFETVKNRFAGG